MVRTQHGRKRSMIGSSTMPNPSCPVCKRSPLIFGLPSDLDEDQRQTTLVLTPYGFHSVTASRSLLTMAFLFESMLSLYDFHSLMAST